VKPTPIRLYEAGFHFLVSVIPPNAPLSPNSRVQPSQRGKTPGRRNANGTWAGYAWLDHVATLDDAKRWANDGANIGLQAAYYPGVDIDTLDPWLAGVVQQVAVEVLGPAPCRIGRAPKRLLMYRTGAPFARLAVIIHKDGQKHLVEVLGQGRQYLIDGVHPSGSRYSWDRDITEVKLTQITLADVERFFAVLTERLDMFDLTVERVGDGKLREKNAQPQADLLAPSFDALREAVALIPNGNDLFPERDDYIKMGYAIRAAAGEEHEEDAFELFLDWAVRWDGGTNDPDVVRSDWRRMHPPYSVGWGWIAELAAGFGFERAKHEFEADKVEATKDEAERDEGPPAYSDQWLTERVLEESGQLLRYVNAFGRWYVWDGSRWRPDAVLLADFLISSALRRQAAIIIRRGATAQQQRVFEKLAHDICSAARLSSVRTLLRADPRIAAPPDAFDANPWQLNTPAGIVDLVTGSVLPPDPAAMCSRQTVVAPDFEAEAPQWQRFLTEATAGDAELQRYLQRLAGYALTGLTREQILSFIWGPGGNGKSVFANTLQHVLQDYAETAPMDTFVASAHDRHPTDLAGLVGARLVLASETQSGRRWDEQRLKALTGGDAIRARYMRQDFFTYTPQFTLVFIGNHKPEITHLDDAIRRRIHMVPFTVTPREVDPQLVEKLKAEAPVILAWMVRGCVAWQRSGLTPPERVVAATQEYFEDEDSFGRFLDEVCGREAEAITPLDVVYRAWLEWSNARGESAGSIKKLVQLLVGHQLERCTDPATRRSAIRGITVRVGVGDGLL
jgi:P4 family phage/plasmid primase-like protien